MPTSPVYYSHFTLGNQRKVIFQQYYSYALQIIYVIAEDKLLLPHLLSAVSCKCEFQKTTTSISALLLRHVTWCAVLWSVCVCLSVCPRALSLEPMDRSSRNFVCRSPVYVARPSFGGVIRYVLPVLWMTSRLAVLGRMAKCRCCTIVKRLPRVALGHLGGVWCLWMPCLLMKRSESRPTTIQQLLSLA